jgi:two-component system invasion response regulator UvrY
LEQLPGSIEMKKRIILIDDEPLILNLIKELIEDENEIEVAAVTSSKAEFLDLVSTKEFDAALIDISVEDREGGFEILRILKERKINLPSIILSAHDEVHFALRSLQCGAKGYVNKGRICMDLVAALKEILSGRLFVSGEKGTYILNRYENLLEKGFLK